MKVKWCLGALLLIAGQVDAAPQPGPGQLIFSELSPSPTKNTTHEFVEFYNRSDEAVSVSGCILRAYRTSGETNTCALLNNIPGYCATLGALEVPPHGYAATYRGNECAPEGVVYSTIGLYTSASIIELWCQGDGETLEVVTSHAFDWGTTSGATTGRSLQYHQDLVETGDPENPNHWCVASTDLLYCSYEEGTKFEYGTPGQPNVCPELTFHPDEANVIITELSIWPTSGSVAPEWLELQVLSLPSDEPHSDLKDCHLRITECEESECFALTDFSDSDLVPLESSLRLAVDQRVVIAADEPGDACLFAEEGSGGPSACTTSATPDLLYDYTDFKLADDSKTRRVDLLCPDDTSGNAVLIDAVIYNGDELEADCCDDKCSWELRSDVLQGLFPGSLAELNDDPLHWGAAPLEEAYLAGYTDELEAVTAYGSPRTANQAPPRVEASLVAEGDALITELAIWPSSSTDSPDWIEVQMIGESPYERFSLKGCQLRIEACYEGAAPEDCLPADGKWDDSSVLSERTCGPDSELYAAPGDIRLFGSSSTDLTVELRDALPIDVDGTVGVALSSTGVKLLELACPDENDALAMVDRVLFSQDWVSSACPQVDGRCSWALRPGQEDPGANDYPAAWTRGEADYIDPQLELAYGSPGGPNLLEAPYLATAGHPDEGGQVVFAELLVSPPSGNPEWIELASSTDSDSGLPWELSGCMVIKQKYEKDPETGAWVLPEPCTPDDLRECASVSISSSITLPIGAEGLPRRLLATKGCLSYGASGYSTPDQSRCAVPADLIFSSGDLSLASDPEILRLYCPDDTEASVWNLVDEFDYIWSDFSSQCAELTPDGLPLKTCSYAVHKDHLTASENDCTYYRCVTPASSAYTDAAGTFQAGTPGQENTCLPLPQSPQEGEVIITEMSISPVGTDSTSGVFANEWFETYNLAERPIELRSCRLIVVPVEDNGAEETDSAKQFSLATSDVTLNPMDYQLWAVDGCMFGYTSRGESGPTPYPEGEVPTPATEAATSTSDTEVCGVPPGFEATGEEATVDYAYDSLTFSSSRAYHFKLVCEVGCDEELLIDAIPFDFEGDNIEEGHSWQLSLEHLDAVSNDNPDNWCQASYLQRYMRTPEGSNYGTPGNANDCSTPLPCTEIGPACRCNSSESESPKGSLTLLSMTLASACLVGRRRRSGKRRV